MTSKFICNSHLSLWAPLLKLQLGTEHSTGIRNVAVVVVHVESLSGVQFFATPWTSAYQASLCLTISEFAHTHVHRVGDAIQPSHPLSPLFPPVLSLSQHQGLSSELALCIRWPKYWRFSFSISPSNEYSGLISFRIDWFNLLDVQGTLQSLIQHHNSKASVLQNSAFFMVQLSHSYMTTEKTIALTVCNFVGKVVSLLFNTLFSFVIAFLPRCKHLLISRLQSRSAVILELKKIKSITVSTFSPTISHEVIGLNAMIFIFECWVVNQLFHSPLSPSSRSSNLSQTKLFSPGKEEGVFPFCIPQSMVPPFIHSLIPEKPSKNHNSSLTSDIHSTPKSYHQSWANTISKYLWNMFSNAGFPLAW